jgi:sterol desaturase/sphingolipid hydroxylase (fatty acid hydroxylase superfamily)
MKAESGKIHNKGTKVLFKNPIIEKLSRTHIAVPISILSIYAIGLLCQAIFYTEIHGFIIAGLFFAGLFLFTFVEYMMHRYVFHMSTETKVKEKMQYAFHGVHHEFPKDKDRLAMPPLVSFALATVLLFIVKFFIGDYVFGFLPGFLIGYSLYLGVHFIVHAYQPPKNFFKVLWINHGIHHYKDDDKAFGVSSPMWDYIFGTNPQIKK